ncbi:MAG: DUF167 domain-containing protein [Myxococcales bacterium]|nr:MAG: DUF167 domain-containing protein [Myxococcales bacterium]
MIHVESKDGAVYVGVKVVPGASRTRCLGELDGRLKIAVAAAPEKGRANTELAAFVAEQIGVRRRDVTVESGHASPIKTLRIANASLKVVRQAFGI